MTVEVFSDYGLRRILNLTGIETVIGAASVPDDIAAAMAGILPRYVDMNELQSVASAEIAATTGAEAGCITNCAASGISVCVAAAMTGCDLSRVEQLPNTDGMKNEVVLQKGHDVHFGTSVSQMIRLAGAKIVEFGTATSSALFQLQGAIGEKTAAGLYVVSHHTVQFGMIPLREFCSVCHDKGVPVIVDAAAEYNISELLDAGADLVIFSGHKAILGPTSGIIAGRRNLVRACYHQEYGIGRAMKAGKESLVGALAALRRARSETTAGQRDEQAEQRLETAEAFLKKLPGCRVERQDDPTGNPFTRLALSFDKTATGWDVHNLAAKLASGNPSVVVRTLHADLGYLLLDMRVISDDDLGVALDAIKTYLALPPNINAASRANRGDKAKSKYEAWPIEFRAVR